MCFVFRGFDVCFRLFFVRSLGGRGEGVGWLGREGGSEVSGVFFEFGRFFVFGWGRYMKFEFWREIYCIIKEEWFVLGIIKVILLWNYRGRLGN